MVGDFPEAMEFGARLQSKHLFTQHPAQCALIYSSTSSAAYVNGRASKFMDFMPSTSAEYGVCRRGVLLAVLH